RYNQPPVERDRDADVDVRPVNRAVAGHGGIDDRMLAQILRAGFRDEREEREVHAPLGIALLRFAAQLRHAREVDFEEARHVRRHTPRHHHVIGRDLADLGPGLDTVAGPRLDGGVLDGTRACGGSGLAGAGAAAGFDATAPASVSSTATSVCTGTVCPSCTLISARTPAAGAGISASTLSVEISNNGSSRFTGSPTFLSHLLKVPSAIDSPICGINTSTRAIFAP